MSNFITHKNAKIYFTDKGSGKAILLLHGFLENKNMWNNLTPHLIKTNRVISVDLLGHGETESIGYVHTMEFMADAVIAVIKQLSIKDFFLIGHSMGGYVSLAILESNPNIVKGLCLMNSTAIADSPEKKRNRDRAIEAVKKNCKMFVSLSISNLFRPKSRILYKKAFKNVKNEALKTPVQSIIASLEGMKIRKDRLELFKSVKIKKLVLLGKKDAILNYDLQISLYQNSGAKVIGYPDGHMSHIENMRVFTYDIMHFIENI